MPKTIQPDSPQWGRADACGKMMGAGRSTFWRYAKQDGFPKPVKLSPRCTVWNLDEINDWMKNQNREGVQK